MPHHSHITAIEPAARNPKRANIRVGNRVAACLSVKLVTQLGLGVGQVWNEPLAARVREATAYDKALSQAVKMVSRRPLSRAHLQVKLQAQGWEPALTQRVLQRLEELGLSDDEALARQWVAQLTATKPAGPALLQAKLRQRGFAEALIDRLLREQAVVGPSARDEALRLAERKRAALARLDPATQRRRLYGLLARRGFADDLIQEVLDQLKLPEETDRGHGD